MCENLTEWEESLNPYFGHINLLGEIPIPGDKLERLGMLIRDLVRRYGQRKATRLLEIKYCHTFVVFLAATAAHNTFGEYWRAVSKAVGISEQRLYQLKWGEIFLRVLEKNSLPTFQDLGSYKYVAPIRLHGGIPAYSLPDFFAHLLWPSVNEEKYKYLTTGDVLQTLLESPIVQNAVDSPVTNFLQNGEKYAVEFFDRCREMVRCYIQSGEVPSTNEIQLPLYVVRTFQKWVDEELETEKGKRFRAPKLFLDPWGPDFYLHLPPEKVEGRVAKHRYFWRIEAQVTIDEKYEHIERVCVKRRGFDLETSDVTFPLENLSQKIVVSYCREEVTDDDSDNYSQRTLRRWSIDLLPNEAQIPLVAFRPTDGRILSWTQTLPAEELWLLFPADMELEFDGKGLIREYFPNFTGYGDEWNIQSWDLSQVSALKLLRNGKEVCAPIPVLSASSEPTLVGDNLLRENIDPDDVPLYIGSPPLIQIPVRPGKSAKSELLQWKLHIKSHWAASPSIQKEFQLSNITSYLANIEDTVDIPLSIYLGERPCGTYSLVLTGPNKLQKEFRFRVWPELTLDGLQKYYLPGIDGASEVKFNITVPEEYSVEPPAGVERVQVQRKQTNFQVTVDPEVTVANLHLIAPMPEGDPIRVPLSIIIPRLRWSLLLGQPEAQIRWRASVIKSTVDALLQAEQATLYFDLPLVDELPVLLNINLVNPEDRYVLQQYGQPKQVRYRQTRWRFPLGEFFDTIRFLEDQPIFELQLEIKNIHTDESLCLPIVRLSRTLDIKDVWIEYLEEPTFCLKWIETKPLRNRRVQIWSVWQPWNSPIELSIPDEAKGEWKVTTMGLPHSQYRFHFLTAAPWDPSSPPDEPPEDSILVATTTPEERLKTINEQLSDHSKNSFLLHFERACIYNSQKDFKTRDQEITWCWQHLSESALDQILAFHRWLGGIDPNSQKAVRLYMYRPDKLERLFSRYREPHPRRDAYLEHISGTRLEPESVLLLLENVSDPVIVMKGLETLVTKGHCEAINYIVKFLKNGQLSDSDAGELLALNPDFTLPVLEEMPESAMKQRLIQQIVKVLPDQETFVWKDFWIQTDAGWGVIKKIVSESGDQEILYFNRKVEKPLLYVTLCLRQGPEEDVKINLANQTITFENAKRVYVCNKDRCYKFASEHIESINDHNRVSHGGCGSAFELKQPCFPMRNSVIYSIDPPQDSYA